jgi:hypothetical protein
MDLAPTNAAGYQKLAMSVVVLVLGVSAGIALHHKVTPKLMS